MPTEAELHEEAAAEYDAAFDWYLQQSPEAALKFDAEVERALAHIIQAPQRWTAGALHAPLLAQTIPFYHDLPRPYFSGHSDRRDRAHESKARILEGTNLVLPFIPS